MEYFTKIAILLLVVIALVTFWPLVVLLLSVLAVFLVYSSWKAKKLMKQTSSSEPVAQVKKDVFDAEYTEREIHHE